MYFPLVFRALRSFGLVLTLYLPFGASYWPIGSRPFRKVPLAAPTSVLLRHTVLQPTHPPRSRFSTSFVGTANTFALVQAIEGLTSIKSGVSDATELGTPLNQRMQLWLVIFKRQPGLRVININHRAVWLGYHI